MWCARNSVQFPQLFRGKKVPNTSKAFGAISHWPSLLILFGLWECHRRCWVFKVKVWKVDDTLSTWPGTVGRITATGRGGWFSQRHSWATLCTARFLGSELLDSCSLSFSIFWKGWKGHSQPFWHGFTPTTKAIVELVQSGCFDCEQVQQAVITVITDLWRSNWQNWI